MKMHRRSRFDVLRATATLTAAALLTLAAPAGAQDAAQAPKLVAIVGIQSATVAPSGLGFVSLGGTTRREGSDDDDVDGSLAFGVGIGSAEDAVGVQVTAYITSLTDDFGDSGSFALKASRRVASGPVTAYAALGVDDIAGFGDADDIDPRVTLSFSTFSLLSLGASGTAYPLMATVGIGSDLRNDRSDPGVFAGVGLGMTPNLGVSAAWTSEAFDLASVFRVPGVESFAFTAAVNDVFDQDDSRRLTFSVNYFLRNLF
jgi:hypothetical protein